MSAILHELVERRLGGVLDRRMRVEPVIILQGPRAVGKSTLLQELALARGRDVIDLDDLDTREAVQADPALFVRGEAPVLIDEFQHVPVLLDAIKAELNRDGAPGRFVLTGSTRYATLPAAAQALTGRAHRVDVLPLSQGEIAGAREGFVQTLLSDPSALVDPSPPASARDEYVRRVVAGGFPMALTRTRAADRARWFEDYVELVIERDVLELSRVQQRRQLPLLLRQLAGQTAQVLNIAKAARAIGMEKSTAESYTKLLETVFLIHQLPAWGTTLGPRVGAAPKVHVVDSGLAARLLRLTEDKLGAASASALTEFGHLLETFVVGEVCKQLDWLDAPVARGHWRTHDGDEVDLVLERDDGAVAALEVKAASRVTARELRSLHKLRAKLGAGFLGGVVLYTGARSYTHEGIQIVPVSRLWRGHDA
ncbi:MAG TPA: ATP-binding protein [Solirubrobacteraceae bacterium]|jgi:predicted AAA+ superfamily ATPase|nr:ATP-binding protein [Solirubrobacteraceae bacterium]